jgi:hypothetical protein
MSLAVTAALGTFGVAGAAQAGSVDYRFTLIAQYDGGVAGSAALNDNGDVAYAVSICHGTDDMGFCTNRTRDVYARVAGELRRVHVGTDASGDAGAPPLINNAGAVAFSHRNAAGEWVVTRVTGGTTEGVASASSLGFHSVFATSMNNAGNVAAHAAYVEIGDVRDSIFTLSAEGGAAREVAKDSNRGGPFDFYGNDGRSGPDLNDAGSLLIVGINGGGQSPKFTDGVYVLPADGGGPVTIAQFPFGNGNSADRRVVSTSISDGSVIGYAVQGEGLDGILTGSEAYVYRNGAARRVLDSDGAFTSITNLSVNDAGDFAALATLDRLPVPPDMFAPMLGSDDDDPALGIFTGSDPVADKVIARGDELFGRPVHGLTLSRNGLNDSGQIVFTATLDGGGSVVVLADPVTAAIPLPPALPAALATIGVAGGVGAVRRRRA